MHSVEGGYAGAVLNRPSAVKRGLYIMAQKLCRRRV